MSEITATSTRPWSCNSTQRPQSRPVTARPQTGASSRHTSSYVVAILEGRGVSRDVGIAALDRDTGNVYLVQVCHHFYKLHRILEGVIACGYQYLRQIPATAELTHTVSNHRARYLSFYDA